VDKNQSLEELKTQLQNISNTVNSLKAQELNQNNNQQELEQQVNKLIKLTVKLEPIISIDKSSVINNGVDQAKITIKTLNNDGTVVPYKNVYITIFSLTTTITTDNNGIAEYFTPKKLPYNATSMTISIQIDGQTYIKEIGIENYNSQPTPTPCLHNCGA
jgi:hypothetical protein